MNGDIAGLGFIFGVIAWILWHHGKTQPEQRKEGYDRIAAAVGGLAVLGLLISLAPTFAALWLAIGTGAGLTILVIGTLITGYLAYKVLIKGGEHHHTRGGFALAGMLAFMIAMWIGGWQSNFAEAKTFLSGAGDAFSHLVAGKAATTATTHAHHTAHHGSALGTGAAVALAAIAMAIGAVIYWRSARQHAAETGGTRQQRQQIPAGGRASLAGSGSGFGGNG